MAKQLKRIGVVEARKEISRLMEEAYQRNIRFILERHGVPLAVLIGINEYQQLLEDKQDIADMAESLASEGKWEDFNKYHKARLARVQGGLQKSKGTRRIRSHSR